MAVTGPEANHGSRSRDPVRTQAASKKVVTTSILVGFGDLWCCATCFERAGLTSARTDRHLPEPVSELFLTLMSVPSANHRIRSQMASHFFKATCHPPGVWRMGLCEALLNICVSLKKNENENVKKMLLFRVLFLPSVQFSRPKTKKSSPEQHYYYFLPIWRTASDVNKFLAVVAYTGFLLRKRNCADRRTNESSFR